MRAVTECIRWKGINALMDQVGDIGARFTSLRVKFNSAISMLETNNGCACERIAQFKMKQPCGTLASLIFPVR
jgi:hypothetical protein